VLDRLPPLFGRSHAIQIALGANDFDAGTAERFAWINRAVPDAELVDFAQEFVRRLVTLGGQALRPRNGVSIRSVAAE
jgi:enoyl-CoA hydratase/carnithine racemase